MKICKFKDFLKESVDNKMKYYLPTYEECREICDANDNFIFFESKQKIQNFDVSFFNNRLAMPLNFEKPIEGKDIVADELRRLAFVFNKDGTIFNRYLLLNKFWNLNQSQCSFYSVVKEFKIKNVMDKIDGSVASFIKLPNGNIVSRSKSSLATTQADGIQKIYDTNENIKKFVDYCYNNGIAPIFEYISPSNRIVLAYTETNLVLTKLRDNNTGKYLNINDYKDYLDGINVADFETHYTLDKLIELKSVLKNKEGWVVQFESGKMIKIKTSWYEELHHFVEATTRENLIIEMILKETIDDAMAMLNEDDLRRKRILEIDVALKNYFVEKTKRIEELCKEFKGNYKEYALKYRKDPDFSVAINVIRKGSDIIELLKNKILDNTKTLSEAINFLKKLGC